MNLRQLICHHLYRFHHGYNITDNWKCVKCGHVKSGFKPVYWHLLKKEYEDTTEELLGKESQEKFDYEYNRQISTYVILSSALIAIISTIYLIIKQA